MRRLAPALVLLACSACGYQPPAQTDVSKPAYRTDLDACHDAAVTEVGAHNAKTGLAWMAGPVRRWGQIAEAEQACMAAKGYGRIRTCTDEEIRNGAKSGNVVVTAAGIRCAEPPTPERRRAG